MNGIVEILQSVSAAVSEARQAAEATDSRTLLVLVAE